VRLYNQEKQVTNKKMSSTAFYIPSPTNRENKMTGMVNFNSPKVNSKSSVPSMNEPCGCFEARKGAFAALGRCSKCNFRLEEHKVTNNTTASPAFATSSIKPSNDKLIKAPTSTPGKAPLSSEKQVKIISSPFIQNELKRKNASGNGTMVKLSAPIAHDVKPITKIPALSVVSPTVGESKVLQAKRKFEQAQPPIAVRNFKVGSPVPAKIPPSQLEKLVKPYWIKLPSLVDISMESDAGQTEDLPKSPSPVNVGGKSPSQSTTTSLQEDSSSPSITRARTSSIAKLAPEIKVKMEEAKDSWQAKVGDALPICIRCGCPIEATQTLVASGLQRFHQSCPSREESNKGPRNSRFMVQKADERVILTVRLDKESKQPFTFMFDLDQATKHHCLRMINNAEMCLVYLPDTKCHAPLERSFRSPKIAEYDFTVRYQEQFSFTNPATKETVAPKVDLKGKTLSIKKFCESNSVLRTMEAKFFYDEERGVLSADRIELRFSMMPGAQSNLPAIISSKKPSTVKSGV
jgi:hypothetical protein